MAESSEPRETRWSVVWHGYVREVADGQVVREGGTGCRVEELADGSWMVCDERGCLFVAKQEAGSEIARCLLGWEDVRDA